mgnify:CR=1 FL=1
MSNSSFNYSYSENWVEGFNITCQNETFIYYYNQYETHDYESVFHYTDNEIFDERTKINIGFIAYFILMYFFIILFLNRRVTRLLIKFKWYRRWIPKHNAEGTIFKKKKRYYKKFKPNDVFENIVIIPQFENVVLDYKTKGDLKNKLIQTLQFIEDYKPKGEELNSSFSKIEESIEEVNSKISRVNAEIDVNIEDEDFKEKNRYRESLIEDIADIKNEIESNEKKLSSIEDEINEKQKEKSKKQNKMDINVSSLKRGVYYIRLTDNTQIYSGNFVKTN